MGGPIGWWPALPSASGVENAQPLSPMKALGGNRARRAPHRTRTDAGVAGSDHRLQLKMHFLAPPAARSTLPALPPWERQSSPQLSQFSPIDYPQPPPGLKAAASV